MKSSSEKPFLKKNMTVGVRCDEEELKTCDNLVKHFRSNRSAVFRMGMMELAKGFASGKEKN